MTFLLALEIGLATGVGFRPISWRGTNAWLRCEAGRIVQTPDDEHDPFQARFPGVENMLGLWEVAFLW